MCHSFQHDMRQFEASASLIPSDVSHKHGHHTPASCIVFTKKFAKEEQQAKCGKIHIHNPEYSDTNQQQHNNNTSQRKYIESTSSGYGTLDDTSSIESADYSTAPSCITNNSLPPPHHPKQPNLKPLTSDKGNENISGEQIKNHLFPGNLCQYTKLPRTLKKCGVSEGVNDTGHWQRRCHALEMQCKELESIMMKKDADQFVIECTIRQTKIMVKEEQNKVKKLKEQYDNLINSLLVINNLFLEKSDNNDIRETILELMQDIDIFGQIGNDEIFMEERQRCVSNVDDAELQGEWYEGQHDGDREGACEDEDDNDVFFTPQKNSCSANHRCGKDEGLNRFPHPKAFQNILGGRRHSVAVPCIISSKLEEKSRRSSMVIRTTLSLQDGQQMKEESHIESIHLPDNNNRERKKSHRKPVGHGDHTRQRRHSMQIPRHYCPPSQTPRHMSYNLPSTCKMNIPSNQSFSMFPGTHNICDAMDNTTIEHAMNARGDSTIQQEAVAHNSKGFKDTDISYLNEHSYEKKCFIMVKKCHPCGNRIKLGKCGYKCTNCAVVCHLECMHNVPLPCHIQSSSSTPGEIYTNSYFQSPPLFDSNE